MNSGVCKHKFCELTQSPRTPTTPLPDTLPRLLIVLSSTEYSMHAQMLPLSLNHAGPSALKRSTMQERGEATTVQKERGRERGREGNATVTRWGRGALGGALAWTPVWLLTLFHCLSFTWWSVEREALPYFTVSSHYTPPPSIHTRTLGPLPSSSHHSLALPVAYSILTALIQAGYSSRPD